MDWEQFTLANPPSGETRALVRWLGDATWFEVATYDEDRRRWLNDANQPVVDVTHYAVITDPTTGDPV